MYSPQYNEYEHFTYNNNERKERNFNPWTEKFPQSKEYTALRRNLREDLTKIAPSAMTLTNNRISSGYRSNHRHDLESILKRRRSLASLVGLSPAHPQVDTFEVVQVGNPTGFKVEEEGTLIEYCLGTKCSLNTEDPTTRHILYNIAWAPHPPPKCFSKCGGGCLLCMSEKGYTVTKGDIKEAERKLAYKKERSKSRNMSSFKKDVSKPIYYPIPKAISEKNDSSLPLPLPKNQHNNFIADNNNPLPFAHSKSSAGGEKLEKEPAVIVEKTEEVIVQAIEPNIANESNVEVEIQLERLSLREIKNYIGRALELFNLPKSFRNSHIVSLFKGFGPFEVYWVNGSRAVLIFEDCESAELAMKKRKNPLLVDIRMYDGILEEEDDCPGADQECLLDEDARKKISNSLGARRGETLLSELESKRQLKNEELLARQLKEVLKN